MKLYTVWSGEYSDRGMYAIFQSKEKAERYVEVHTKLDGPWSDDYYIIEYELADDKFDINTPITKYYCCDIYLEDSIGDGGVIYNREGDISTDERWDKLKEDFVLERYEDLKPEVYGKNLSACYNTLDDLENDYNATIEYMEDDKEVVVKYFTDYEYVPAYISVYSSRSYAHARKIAIDKYYEYKAQRDIEGGNIG